MRTKLRIIIVASILTTIAGLFLFYTAIMDSDWTYCILGYIMVLVNRQLEKDAKKLL